MLYIRIFGKMVRKSLKLRNGTPGIFYERMGQHLSRKTILTDKL